RRSTRRKAPRAASRRRIPARRGRSCSIRVAFGRSRVKPRGLGPHATSTARDEPAARPKAGHNRANVYKILKIKENIAGNNVPSIVTPPARTESVPSGPEPGAHSPYEETAT